MFGNIIRTIRRKWNLVRLSPETRIYWRSYINDPPCAGSYIGLGKDGKAGHLLQGYRVCLFNDRYGDRPELWARIPVLQRESHLHDDGERGVSSPIVWRTSRRPYSPGEHHIILYKDGTEAGILVVSGSEPFDHDLCIAWAEYPGI